jgi:hypothetical protein
MPNPNRSDVHVNVPLTNISIAYIQNADRFIASQVFPNIPVPKQSDRFFTYSKADWFRDEAQLRASGTESAGGGYNIDNTPTYFSNVYGIHKDVDDQIRANADIPLDMDRDGTEWLTQQLLIKRERIWASRYFIPNTWGTGSSDLVGVNISPTTGQFLQWDNANATPVEDIIFAATAIEQQTGFAPNTLVLSPYVFNALKNNADVLDRIKYTQRGIATTDILAALFEVDNVLVARSAFNSAAEGATGVFDFIVSSKSALLCYANPRPSILTPSAGYTFSWTGYLGAGNAGNRIKTFRMENLAADRIEAEMAFDSKLISADLGQFFTTCIA